MTSWRHSFVPSNFLEWKLCHLHWVIYKIVLQACLSVMIYGDKKTLVHNCSVMTMKIQQEPLHWSKAKMWQLLIRTSCFQAIWSDHNNCNSIYWLSKSEHNASYIWGHLALVHDYSSCCNKLLLLTDSKSNHNWFSVVCL